MAASTNPFSITGALSFPPDEGQSPVPVQLNLSGVFTQVADQRLVMVGSGTQAVSFGTIATPGVKAMLIEYDAAGGSAAVNVRFNGGTDDIELKPGGFILYGNPAPANGITSISLAHTADAVVRVRLLG